MLTLYKMMLDFVCESTHHCNHLSTIFSLQSFPYNHLPLLFQMLKSFLHQNTAKGHADNRSTVLTASAPLKPKHPIIPVSQLQISRL